MSRKKTTKRKQATHLHREEAAILGGGDRPLGIGLGKNNLGRDGLSRLQGHHGLLPLGPTSLQRARDMGYVQNGPKANNVDEENGSQNKGRRRATTGERQRAILSC